MSRTVLVPVLWLALMSADRIDLLGGTAGFILTPFLAITPLYLAFEALRLALFRERLSLPQGTRVYAALLCSLLTVAFASTLLGIDVQASARRAVLLLAMTTATFLAAVALVGRGDLARVLVGGAKLGLVVAVLFNIGGVIAFLSSDLEALRLGPVTIALDPFIYAGFVPRFSGSVADPNRAGLVFLIYLFCLARWGKPGPGRRVWMGTAFALLLITLSRSALLAGLAVGALATLERKGVQVSRAAVAAAAVGVGLVAGLFLFNPDLGRAVAVASEPVAYRFSPTEGSMQDHAYLMARGLEESTASVRRAAIGIGYGNANLVLQDMFPGDKYGNFHSLYLSMWAESGVLALLLVLVLLGAPLARRGPLRPLVAGFVVFNLFYQSNAEPVFWLMLASAWLLQSDEPTTTPVSREAA